MTLAEDFEDFVKLLNQYNVEYMVVGGYALVLVQVQQNIWQIQVEQCPSRF